MEVPEKSNELIPIMSKLTERVAFDLIRYANCWEDADVLLRGLNPEPGKRFLSIASAGDNSFSLLTANPELVVAVDVNPIQLYVVELKREAIRRFDYKEVLSFLGFESSETRLEQYDLLAPYLSEKVREYWDHHQDFIAEGLIHKGKFEGYFRLFAGKVLPWIHKRKTTDALLSPKSAEEQRAFHDKHWDTWRWRFFFKIFFSKTIMGRYGRDPQFLKEVGVNVGETIYNKATQHLRSAGAQQNFILNYNLTGDFGGLLPHYLQPDNFEKIKANLDKLVVFQGYAEEAIAQHGSFHYMNLSNIFEYMNPELFASTAQGLVNGLEHGGKLAYWNLMVPRSIAQRFPDQVQCNSTLSDELTAVDKGFFYQQFYTDFKL